MEIPPVTPEDAPRCNLVGHGVFKGAEGRMEGFRRGDSQIREKNGRRYFSRILDDDKDDKMRGLEDI